MINLLSFSEYVKFDSKLGIQYKKMFRVKNDRRNDFRPLEIFKNTMGIYYFVSCDGTVLYIGESHEQGLYDRIAQHFSDDDTGGLRYKLIKNERKDLLDDLENSVLYVFPLGQDKDFVTNLEKRLINLYNPRMNGKVDKKFKCGSMLIGSVAKL